MSNRIVLIRPPSLTKRMSFIASQFPINIASIAASLVKKGYEVRIWDYDAEDFEETSFCKKLKDFSPFIVGISCYTPTIINGHKIAKVVKSCLPAALIAVGGPHISAMPEDTLTEFNSFDVGVIGEGEEVMSELADAVAKEKKIDDVAGIIYRERGSNALHMTGGKGAIKDLDSIPFPARGLLDMKLYKGQSHRGFSRDFLKITEIMTSRGCPNRCIFCASDVVMGAGVRFRSADSVKAEIEECVARYGFNHFTISDDTFTLKEERLYEICDEFAKLRLTWNCNARVWPMSRKMLSVMAKSGCTGITFGVESGSPRILKLIKKNISIGQIEDAFRWAREAGIKLVEADVILGSHPSETRDDIKMTKKLLRKISPDIIMVSIIVPYPGTEVYRIMRDKKLILKDKMWDLFILFGREPSWKTEHFSPKELVSLQRNMMLSFYFRPLYILSTLAKFKNPREITYWLRGGTDFLFNCFKGNSKVVPKSRSGY